MTTFALDVSVELTDKRQSVEPWPVPRVHKWRHKVPVEWSIEGARLCTLQHLDHLRVLEYLLNRRRALDLIVRYTMNRCRFWWYRHSRIDKARKLSNRLLVLEANGCYGYGFVESYTDSCGLSIDPGRVNL